MKNYSRNELAKEILKGLAVGGLILTSLAAPNILKIAELFGVKNYRDRFKFKRTSTSLQRKKLINIYEKDGDQIMEITEKGKKKVLKYKFDDLKINTPEKWDKKWRIVIFDIPEPHKTARMALNQKLKELHFYPLQKSVFVFPYDCKDEIEFISNFFAVRKYINYFTTADLEGDYKLRKFFDL